MPVKVEIITSKDCPFCAPAEKVVREVCKKFGRKVKLVKTSTDTKVGAARAKALGIVMVPTILVENEPKFTGVVRPEHLRDTIKLFLSEK